MFGSKGMFQGRKLNLSCIIFPAGAVKISKFMYQNLPVRKLMTTLLAVAYYKGCLPKEEMSRKSIYLIGLTVSVLWLSTV